MNSRHHGEGPEQPRQTGRSLLTWRSFLLLTSGLEGPWRLLGPPLCGTDGETEPPRSQLIPNHSVNEKHGLNQAVSAPSLTRNMRGVSCMTTDISMVHFLSRTYKKKSSLLLLLLPETSMNTFSCLKKKKKDIAEKVQSASGLSP